MKFLLSSPHPALLCLAVASGSVKTAAAGGCFENAAFFHPEDWKFCQPVANHVFMYYTPFEEEGNVMVGLHVTEESFGWTALALAGNGGMKGASQILVRKEEDGEWVAEDRHSEEYTTPALDEQQDVKLLFADQSDGETSWAVLLPMNSCDLDNDYPIEDKSMYMHWALGSHHTFSYHGNRRGQFRANLLQAYKADNPNPEGLEFMDILMPNVPVVMGEGGNEPTNPYICAFFDLHEMSEGRFGPDEKIHVTHFSAILAEDSKQYVHHMLMYACSDDEESERGHLSIVPECESMPPGCDIDVKWGYAPGDTGIIFPPHVAVPLNDGKRWLAMQVHYFNENLDEGVTDKSGVRAYITTDLREQEAGMLSFDGGTTASQRPPLPSGESNYLLPTFTVPSSCTEAGWTSPLNILAVSHHMHLYGTKMEIFVQRDGQTHLFRNEHRYDFKHQGMIDPPPALRTLLPGDQIFVNCWYDTTKSRGNVSFGENTQQEMCLGSAYYWPVQKEQDYFAYLPLYDLEVCLSPAIDEMFAANNASLCAQKLYENVPAFLGFEDAVPGPFSVLEACNGGSLFEDLLVQLPGLCPPCSNNSSCTTKELHFHAQEYCVGHCAQTLNAAAYPALSAAEPYNAGTYGCPEQALYFRSPPLPEPAVCEKAGNPDQVVLLQKVEISSDHSGGASLWFFGASLFPGFVALIIA